MVDTNSNSVYVTLVSTASSDVYTGANKNTSAHFINRLKNPLRLEGNTDDARGSYWEVALLDIQLPGFVYVNTTKSLPILQLETTEYKEPARRGEARALPPQVHRDVLNPEGLTIVHDAYVSGFTRTWPPLAIPDECSEEEVQQDYAALQIPAQPRSFIHTIHYRRWILQIPSMTTQSAAPIIEFINTTMTKEFSANISGVAWKFMEYDDARKCLFYRNPIFAATLAFYDNEITQLLGLASEGVHMYKPYRVARPLKPEQKYAKQQAITTRTSYDASYFVYADCVDVCNIGDGVGQLLRLVDANNDHHTLTSFAQPHYRPVSRSSIESIEIDIRNLLGKNPKFQSGCTTCTLHFRKRL